MEESAQIASEYIASLDNLPSEVKFLLGEIKHKDAQLQSLMNRVHGRQAALFKQARLREKTAAGWSPDESEYNKDIEEGLQRARKLSEDKVKLAMRLRRLVHKAKGRLEMDMKKIAKLTGEPTIEDITPTVFRSVDKVSEGLRHAVSTPSASTPVPVGPAQKKRRLTAQQEKIVINLPARSRASHAQPSPLRKAVARTPEESEPEEEEEEDPDENLYCFCQKKSFGEMIGCDNGDCPYQWFHLECVGLKSPAADEIWFCPECVKKGTGVPGDKRRGRKNK